MVKVVLFDLGHTLMYFDAPWQATLDSADRTMVRTLIAAGCQIDEEEFYTEFKLRIHEYYHEREMEYIEYTSEHILRRVLAKYGYPNADHQLVRSALAALYGITESHWQPEVDAIPTLRKLQEAGYRLGLISNASDAQDVDILLDKGHFRPFFEQILVSAAIGLRKPHPRMFELALKHFQILPAEALMVGDKLNADILGAANVGIRSAWITRRIDLSAEQQKYPDVRPDHTIQSLTELPALLAQL